MKSLKGCRLKIGLYPSFNYNASGGGGKAILIPNKKNNLLQVSFLSEHFSIPALTSRTTRFLSLPLPPGLKIKISMHQLEGTINKQSGEVLLRFEAKFFFSILSFVKFPELMVKTLLTTGKVKGKLHEGKGQIIQNNGKTKLVGISKIPKTGNRILDSFLGLPNEALAELQCEFK